MKRKGFTLVELFTVVAVVAVLAAIIFPAYAKAGVSAKSKQMTCVSNLKRIFLGLQMYSQDYNDTLPPAYVTSNGPTPPGGWWFPNTLLWPQLIYPYTQSMQLIICPSRPINNSFPYYGSYGANGSVVISTSLAPSKKLKGMKNPELVYLVFDSGAYSLMRNDAIYPGGSFYLPGAGATGLAHPWSAISSYDQEDYMNGRHNGGVNVAFCDGHVQLVKPEVMIREGMKLNWGAWFPQP